MKHILTLLLLMPFMSLAGTNCVVVCNSQILTNNVFWTDCDKMTPKTEIELEAGWNHVVYAGELIGLVGEVLCTARADGAVSYVTDDYGNCRSNYLIPGESYWVYSNEPYTLKGGGIHQSWRFIYHS